MFLSEAIFDEKRLSCEPILMSEQTDILADDYLVLQLQPGDELVLQNLLVRLQQRLCSLAGTLSNSNVAHDVLQESRITIARRHDGHG